MTNEIKKSYFDNRGFFGVVENIRTRNAEGPFGLFALDADRVELRKMYLVKSVRGKGLGQFILTCAIDWAKDNHFKKMLLETISPLKEAIALYRKNGFIEISPAEINDRVDCAFELDLLN